MLLQCLKGFEAVGRLGTDDEFRPQFAQRFAQLRAEQRLIFGYDED